MPARANPDPNAARRILQAEIPPNVPQPVPVQHPLRCAIHGDEEKIPELKQIVATTEGLHEGLKAFLQDKLDELESNAASIHLHEVDIPGGGALHITWRERHHGRRAMKEGMAVKVEPKSEVESPEAA